MEEHLVPAVPATQKEGHGGMDLRPSPVWVGGQELVPPMRVVEIGDEDPSRGEAAAAEARDDGHELPAVAQRLPHAQGAEQPNAAPEEGGPSHVLHTHRQPLLVELLVALAARARIGELAPPEDGEEAARIARPGVVPEGHQRHGEPAIPLPSPLLENVEPTSGIPAELAMVQQVKGGVVVPVVFHDDIHPGQGPEVRKGVSDVVLPLVRREGGAMDHIVQDVHVLDAEGDHDKAEDCRGHTKADPDAGPVIQHGPIQHNVEALRDEDQGVDVPHVHLLLRADLREHERQV
mmetsp:Transcript_76205/g.191833  ORF Transcript_76205/g.191833 Transcript_76205/m.191833 type:complete len:291 (+) Transcript_76205:347-1219(+)